MSHFWIIKNLNLLNGKDVNCYYYDEIKQLGLNGILTFDRKSEDLIVLSDDKLLNSQKVKLSILYSIIKNKENCYFGSNFKLFR